MGKEADRQKYLRNCAKTLQGQLGLGPETFKDHKTLAAIEAHLKSAKWTATYLRLFDAPDEQVGRLACVEDFEQVRQLATNAVVHAMAVRIYNDLNPKKIIRCRYCDWTTAKFFRKSKMTGFDLLREHIDNEHPDKADEIATAIYGGRDARDEADVEAYVAELESR